MNTINLIDNIIAYIKYGRSKRKGTIYHLRKNNFADITSPIFFLSTGRTGTKWFANILAHNKNLLVFHAPKPDLSVQSAFAYKVLKESNFKPDVKLETAIKEIFLAGREENLRYAYKTKKRYVETNNYITFFAPIIAKVFPDSIFIHLHRHPGEFVRSGLNRDYYSDTDKDIQRRIVSSENTWHNYSQIEKISWLWNETNSFIEHFKNQIDSKRVYTFKFENLKEDELKKLFHFLNITISSTLLRKKIHVKVNVQKKIKVKEFIEWEKKDKERIKLISKSLMEKYNYEI